MLFLSFGAGPTPIGIYGYLEVATAPSFGNIFAVADGNGDWSLPVPIPVLAALLPLQLHMEALVFDCDAPNGFFHQTDLEVVSFR